MFISLAFLLAQNFSHIPRIIRLSRGTSFRIWDTAMLHSGSLNRIAVLSQRSNTQGVSDRQTTSFIDISIEAEILPWQWVSSLVEIGLVGGHEEKQCLAARFPEIHPTLAAEVNYRCAYRPCIEDYSLYYIIVAVIYLSAVSGHEYVSQLVFQKLIRHQRQLK